MGPLEGLAQELLRRELNKPGINREWEAPKEAPRSETATLSPTMMAALGGAMDVAGTYSFMKRGTGVEANPIMRAIGGETPAGTAAAVGLTTAGTMGIGHLLRKLGGMKGKKIADLLGSQQGAMQMDLGLGGLSRTHDRNQRKRPHAPTGFETAADKFRNGVTQRK